MNAKEVSAVNSESDILKILDNNDELSQREIAKLSGFSLGKVNILLKKFAKKGFIKIENLDSNKLRYILTPKGISHLTKKSLSYMINSYKAVNLLISKIKKLSLKKKYEGKEIFIYGEQDEIYDIIISTLKGLNVEYYNIHDIDKTSFNEENKFIVLYWNPNYIEKVKKVKKHNDNVEFKNVLML